MQTFSRSGGNWSKISLGKPASKHQHTPAEGMSVIPHLLSCWQSGQSLALCISIVMTITFTLSNLTSLYRQSFQKSNIYLRERTILRKEWMTMVKSIESTAILGARRLPFVWSKKSRSCPFPPHHIDWILNCVRFNIWQEELIGNIYYNITGGWRNYVIYNDFRYGWHTISNR